MNKTINKWLSFLLLVLVGTVGTSAQTLEVEDFSIKADEVKEVTLVYKGDAAMIGYQTDIELSEGLVFETQPVDKTGIFSLDMKSLGEVDGATNKARLVATSTAGATEVAAGSDLLTLSIKIKGTESFERGTLKLTNQEIVLAGNTPVNPADFTCNITLQGDEPGPEGGKFVLYTGALVPGDYIIYYGGKAMNTTTDKNRLQYEVVTPVDNAITDAPANIIWTIAADGDYFTLYNAAEQVYAVSTGAKNQATTAAEVTDNARWTFTEGREFVNLANTNASVNANLRNNGDYGFAAYGTSTGGTLSLYKKVGADEVVVAMPTITPSASFETSQTVEITAEEGATIYYTTDGTDPTSESTAYTEALTITETTTVKAIAVKDGVSSEVASATFTKIEPITIAEAHALDAGANAFIKGVVVASATDGAVIYDGTDYIYYYNKGANTLEVGKSVSVVGTLGNYGGANQLTAAATVTEIADLDLAIPTEAKALTADDLDDAVTDKVVLPRQLATIEGTLAISGNYVNLTVEGTESAIGSIVKPKEDISELNGKTVKVTGYEMYVNNKYVYFVATSIEELQAQPTTYAITIDENIENGDVVADVETAEAGATVTLSVFPVQGYELDALTVTYIDETGADQNITLTEDNTFVMPAADVNVTATFKETQSETPVIEEGVYYIYNEASGKFLSRGDAWGTRAVGDNYGLPINVVRTEEGKYNLQMVDNQVYYGDDYWMYADCSGDRVRAYTIEEVEGGYTINHPIGETDFRLYIYLKDDADKYAIAGNATIDENISDWNQTVWKFLTQDERDAIVEEREAEEKITALVKGGIPADATEDNLKAGEATALTFKTGSAWTFTAKRSGSAAATNDYGTECFQGTGSFTQTVTGLEPGAYKVQVQAFFRDGANAAVAENYDKGYNLSNAYLDANGSTAAILSWGADRAADDNPNNMEQAAALFADGKYISETYAYVGEDGNLDLAIYQPNFIGYGWFIANEVTYAKVTYDNTSSIDTDLTEEMYHEWNGEGADAEITGNYPNVYCEKHFGEEVAAGGTAYGNGSVPSKSYADLSEYSTLTITCSAESPAMPRLLFNRAYQEDGQGPLTEINSADNKYVTASEDGHTWTIDLAKLVEDEGYAHLIAIKAPWGGAITITDAVLSKVATLYSVTIDENMENGSVEADKTEAEVEETVTLTVTPEDGYELTELLVYYPVSVVDETTSELSVEMVDVVTIPNDDGTYSFTMPAANVTVEATFGEITKNWTFDENPNDVITATTRTYYKDCQEGDVSGLQSVSRWSAAEMSENPGVIGGVFAYGSENLFNNAVTAPAKDPEDGDVGSALGLVAVWTQIAQYTQPITLTSGNYKFTYTVYNAKNTDAVEKNLFGFIAADGTEYLSDKKTFTVGEWETVEVTFTLETETTGNLSVGYVSANGGSGSQPHLFVDNINLEEVSGKDVAQAALKDEIEKAEDAIDGYVIGDNVFQYPETEIQPLIDAVEAAQDVLYDGDATAEELKDALDKLKEAEEAFDPQFNEPVEGQAYNFTLTTSEGTFQLKIDGTANSIAEEGTPVYLVEQQGGTYAITADNTNYVVYEGSNKWTMSTSTEPYGWTITALEDGGYTIAGQNGLYGTNTSDGNAAGSTIYGDKNTGNGNVVWNIEAVQNEPVTTSYTGTLTQTLSHPQAGEMGKEETDNYEIKISEPDADGNVTITYVGGFTFPAPLSSVIPEFTATAKQTVDETGAITYTSESFTVAVPMGQPMGQMSVNYNASLTGTQENAEATPTITLTLQNATTNTVVFGPKAEEYSITEAEAENGSISTDVEEAKEGDKVTITPTAEQGFEVDEIKVTYQTTDDQGLPVTVDVPVTKNEDGTYSFIMPDAPVTIVPTFKEVSTGINAVSASAEAVSDALRNGRVFDLSGRKIRTINNGGIYIVNGKKMKIK